MARSPQILPVLSDTFLYATTFNDSLCLFVHNKKVVTWKQWEHPCATPHLSIYSVLRLTKAQLTDLMLHNFDADSIENEDDYRAESIWSKVYVARQVQRK